jgi:hypothetical protein
MLLFHKQRGKLRLVKTDYFLELGDFLRDDFYHFVDRTELLEHFFMVDAALVSVSSFNEVC